jgi:hypothetical protein
MVLGAQILECERVTPVPAELQPGRRIIPERPFEYGDDVAFPARQWGTVTHDEDVVDHASRGVSAATDQYGVEMAVGTRSATDLDALRGIVGAAAAIEQEQRDEEVHTAM